MSAKDPLLRMAGLIQRRLERREEEMDGQLAAAIVDAQSIHVALATTYRKLKKAHRHGWLAAARLLGEEVLPLARSLGGHVAALQAREMQLSTALTTPMPTLRLIIEELHQLEDEFGDDAVKLRLKADQDIRVIVTTEPITLKELQLGPFAIELHVSRLSERADSGCFEIIALEPRPASTNSEVTHPHVSEGSLCAGDAGLPISQALRQGRIADSFVLVRSVLRTYNAASPYVSIDDWEGQCCSDCGSSYRDDDLYTCERCDSRVCDSCLATCGVCDRSACQGCLELDRVAQVRCCSNCHSLCQNCHRVVAEGEFNQDSGRCAQCHAHLEEQSEEDEERANM